MPITVTANIRNKTLKGIVTKADVIALQRLFMNEEELEVYSRPDPQPYLAAQMMKTRNENDLARFTDELGSEKAANDRILEDWAEVLMYDVECRNEIREATLKRLMEIYPDTPKGWIYWDPEKQLAGHRLEPEEVLNLVITAMGGILSSIPEESTNSPTEKDQSTETTTEPLPDFKAAAKANLKPKAAGFEPPEPAPKKPEPQSEDNEILALTSRLSSLPRAERQAQIKAIQQQLKESQSSPSLLAEVSE